MWVLRTELRSSSLPSKHFTNWALSTVLIYFLFWDSISPSPGWLCANYADEGDLELQIPVLRLQMCTPMSVLCSALCRRRNSWLPTLGKHSTNWVTFPRSLMRTSSSKGYLIVPDTIQCYASISLCVHMYICVCVCLRKRERTYVWVCMWVVGVCICLFLKDLLFCAHVYMHTSAKFLQRPDSSGIGVSGAEVTGSLDLWKSQLLQIVPIGCS